MPIKDYITISELCALGGFSRQWLWSLWSRGDGPPRWTTAQGRVRIPYGPAMEFIAQHITKKAQREVTARRGRRRGVANAPEARL
jgi:predicted DNA-binding transcriptional regulator AlpA